MRHNRVTDLKARRTAPGTSSPSRAPCTPSTSSTPAACGRARSGAWSGLELPILAMEHQYLITEDLPELKGQQGAAALHRLRGRDLHCARSAAACCSAPTSAPACPGRRATTPWDFGQDLLPNDLERIAPSLEVGFEHFPALGEVGHPQGGQRAVHLCARRQSAGRPDPRAEELLGGLRRHGRLQPGRRRRPRALAAGWWRAIPGADIWAMDVARYGDWATLAYTNAKVRENYSRRFRIRFPNEELPAARPLRTTPIYERLQAEHAVFGDYCGLEHPLWFAPERGRGARRRSPSAARTRTRTSAPNASAVREACGLLEISNYGKFEVTGPGAEEWLSHVMANRVPERRPYRAHADAERARQADRRLHHLPGRPRSASSSSVPMPRRSTTGAGSSATQPPAGVSVRPCAMEYVGLSVAGPQLARAAAKPRARRPVDRGIPVPVVPPDGCRHGAGARRARISFTGDLGYEIWVTSEYQRALYDLLQAAGRECGPEALRRPCAQHVAHREELRHLGARVPARSTARTRPVSAASSTSRRATSSGARPPLEERDGGGKLRLVTFASMPWTPTHRR